MRKECPVEDVIEFNMAPAPVRAQQGTQGQSEDI